MRVQSEVERVVKGQRHHVESVLIALLAGGHVLLEGVPGTAKTMMARAVAQVLGIEFRRVQFTPDMLPADVSGTMTIRGDSLAFRPGPVFTNVLLADEINRTPPKTQSALLEAMGEGQVSVDGTSRMLPQPFIVIATQNPIEYEGTYQLPEAQLDRFLLKVRVGYPSEVDEIELLKIPRTAQIPTELGSLPVVAEKEELLDARRQVDDVVVSDDVAGYVARLVRASRELPAVEVGASPRAAVHLVAAARASAWLSGRSFVTPDDAARLVHDVLSHRILLRPEAEIERYRVEDAIEAVIRAVAVPR
ncbi:MAG: MoxR family ATPase [Acidimicrobiia bacterium]|nr:MoxR family ATPase [Acidimicrobiia bacterium]NND12532.1 MoxR family ATPase [Acidimicrobiia bacterium]NNL47186.1 MoxR family ATPase [Acidimicrobiia bacterium]